MRYHSWRTQRLVGAVSQRSAAISRPRKVRREVLAADAARNGKHFKRQFLANIYEPRRTPSQTPFIGYSEMLAEDRGEIGRGFPDLKRSHRAGKHLNDILDLPKIEARWRSSETFDVHEIARERRYYHPTAREG